MKFPIEQLERWLQSSQCLKSRDQHLQIMEKLGDEITVVAALLHVFAYRYDHNSVGVVTESLQKGCKLPEEILPVFQKVWPSVEIAASKWGESEVRHRGKKGPFRSNILLMHLLIHWT